MRSNIYILLLVLSAFQLSSQLWPTIGLNTIPAATAAICKEPLYVGNFYSSGYQQGDTVPDFKLYGLNGDSLVLSQALSGGKPVLLIAGSLTCPVFRAKVGTINQVISTYGSNIKVYVIYTLEAHPTDTSVYFGFVNVTSQNTSAGILFPSPQTYSQRIKMVDTMASYVNLNAPVFIDGPCNNWWKNFGPAPNNSYLIGTNGVVLNKHGWFHKSPDHIFCDLDSILNLNSGLCTAPSTAPGNFSLNVLNSSIAGMPGDLLYDYVDIVNTTSVITTLKIKKIQKVLPVGWQTAICADICYSVQDDSVEVGVDPFDTIKFSLDFITDLLPDTGSVKVGFKNVNKPNNSFSVWLKASTLLNVVGVSSREEKESHINVYPNPASSQTTVKVDEGCRLISVSDLAGRKMPVSQNGETLDTSAWQNGIYFLTLETPAGIRTAKLVINK